jgi:hypothetical protein
VRDAVLRAKRHFPHGAPTLGELRWTDRPSKTEWGFFRYSDRCISINRVLNSPSIPIFVLEFIMFHELLHADMPSAGHNRDFRARERQFMPSAEAIEDARSRGIDIDETVGSGRARADVFLDTFTRYYTFKEPGARMAL